jgi:hypothetical protein
MVAAWWLASSAAAVVARPNAVHAQPQVQVQGDAESDALIARGVNLREQGHDREALELFERAQALSPTPRATAQIALAQQALGRWVQAEAGLVGALAASSDPWIARNRAPLERALDTVRAQLAWLEVDGSVPGAEVWVAGERVGTLPLPGPVRVAAGVQVVELRAAGHQSAVRRVEVRAGEHARESLVLLPVAAPTVPGGVATAQGAEPTVAGSTARTSNTAAWITLGAGAALVAGGVVAHVVRQQDAAIYNDDSRCLAPGLTRDQVCGSYRSTVDTTTALAILGYSLGGAALAVSGYLFWRASASAPGPGAHVASAPRCALAAWGVACSVGF